MSAFPLPGKTQKRSQAVVHLPGFFCREHPPQNGGMNTPLINGEHDTGCLDDRINLFTFLQSKSFGGSFCDNRDDFHTAGKFYDNFGIDQTGGNLFDFSLQGITCTYFHFFYLLFWDLENIPGFLVCVRENAA